MQHPYVTIIHNHLPLKSLQYFNPQKEAHNPYLDNSSILSKYGWSDKSVDRQGRIIDV